MTFDEVPRSRVTKRLIWTTKLRLYFCSCRRRKKFKYPDARREESIVDDFHGTKVSDPYRWLEFPKSPEVEKFIKDQTAFTNKFLSQCQERKYMYKRLTELYDYPKYSCPFRRGNYYYYFKKNGFETDLVLYQQTSLEGESKTFVDLKIENTTKSAIIAFAFSEDGNLLCYSASSCGSDWLTIHFKNVHTLETYPDVLERVKFTNLSWSHDNLGIFYSCYPSVPRASGTDTSQGLNQTLFYHRLGTSADDDVVVVEFPDHPTWGIRAAVSNCGNFLIIYPWKYSGYNGLYFCNLEHHLAKGISNKSTTFDVIPIVEDVGGNYYEYVSNFETLFYIRTNKGASNYHVVGIDFFKSDERNWKVIIPEDPVDVLEWTSVVANDNLLACYSHHVRHILKIFTLPEGKLLRFLDPEPGFITCFSGKHNEPTFFFKLESLFCPAKIFYIHFNQGEQTRLEIKLFREIKSPYVNAKDYTVKNVFYPSSDGTQIPICICHRKGLVLDGNNFCRLYGYGGFGYNNIPKFSPQRLFLIQHLQGVEALANIRGGGEYGENWHKQGCHQNKQTSMNDFQAAAKYLIENKYTNPSKLAVVGASNGGFLVAGCINQKPDLFGAAIPIVGVMDLLRFHKFTIGSCWLREFGNPDDEQDFQHIFKISPLHNIKSPINGIPYPAVLVLTGDHDNRVVPLHSLKYIAELQYKIGHLPQQKNPLMIRVDTKSGHGTGKGYSAVIRELVDVYSFFILTMNLKLKF